MSPRPMTLLLVEPQSLMRSTVVAVAREVRLARIEEISSVDAAAQRLSRASYQGLLLSLDEEAAALDLLTRLRAGTLVTPADTPVVAMTGRCSSELALVMRQHEVRRLLLKPFKVKALLESIQAMAAAPDAPAPARPQPQGATAPS